MKQTYKRILLSIVAICAAVSVAAQEKRVETSISFHQGRSTIDLNHDNNREKLDRVVALLDSINSTGSVVLTSVEFSGAASPEGSAAINRRLSRQRLAAVEEYVRARVSIPEDKITRNDNYIAWDYLVEQIEASDIANKEEIIKIIRTDYEDARDTDGLIVDGHIVALKALDNGATWRMLYKRFFSNMRHAFAAGVSFKQDTKESVNIIAEVKPRELPFPTMDIARADVPSQRPPLHLYLKTNAIGWGMGVSNIAVEIDFGKRWSAQLPIYYSAVNYFTSTIKFRTFAVQPEVRYWFAGNMNDKFFLGAHFGLAYYNYALDGEYRIQDKDGDCPALGGGLSVGYRMPIGQSGRWKMEFSLGAGVYSLKYDKFYNTDRTPNGALSHTIEKTWFGLDHAAVSFSYMFNLKRKSK